MGGRTEPTLMGHTEFGSTKSKMQLSGATVALAQQPGCLGAFSLRYQRGRSWKSSKGGEGCTLLLFVVGSEGFLRVQESGFASSAKEEIKR